MLEPLCEGPLLKRWLRTETAAFAAELDVQFSTGEGWRGRWHGQSAADVWAVPECADRLISALKCHRDRSGPSVGSSCFRAKHLPLREARMQFDNATLEIVDDFRLRLVHVSQQVGLAFVETHTPQATSPWIEPYPQLMNGLWYVAHALEEWAEEAALESAIEKLDDDGEGSSLLFRAFWQS